MPTFNTTDPKPGYVYDSSNDTWYPLVGIAPATQVDRWTKTAAGGETSLSGNDDNAVSLSYTSGTEQVYLNGVLLVRGQDYTATNGTTITGLTALAASDVAEVVTFNPSNILTTDAVIATDFEAKGDIISASAASTPLRVPVGTNGQVLKANSATTSGLEWGTVDADIEGVTAGTGISGGGTSGTVTITNSMATAIDAKGDLIAGTAADTFSRLAVGTNGQVLTAASGEATGLQWATPSAGGMTLIAETVASANSNLSFSSIPATYKELYLVWEGIYASTTSTYWDFRLNNNASVNAYTYLFQGFKTGTTADYITGSSESVSSGNTTYSPFGYQNTSSANYNEMAKGFIRIDNYASTTKYKHVTGQWNYGVTTNSAAVLNLQSIWKNTDAVTSIDVARISGSATFSNATGTSIRLYGIS